MRFSLSHCIALLMAPSFAFSQDAPAVSSSPSSFFDGAARLDFETDALFSDDIDVINSTIRFQQQFDALRLRTSIGQTSYDLNFSGPSGSFVRPSNIEEDSQSYEFGLDWTLNPAVRLTATARYAEGFSDYRSLWISEF